MLLLQPQTSRVSPGESGAPASTVPGDALGSLVGPTGWLPTFCLVSCGLICGVPLFEEFGHIVKDQVEVNCKHDGGKEAKHLWDTGDREDGMHHQELGAWECGGSSRCPILIALFLSAWISSSDWRTQTPPGNDR